MKISFDSIGEKLATFAAAEGLAEGAPCKVTASGTVGACSAGDKFCGVSGSVRAGAAAVVLGGLAELPYTGTAPALGWTKLAADGAGGVKAADSGREVLVVTVDTGAKTAGLFL